ncbi:MAG: acyltransferase, partial [Saprospiraceae bacterium]
MSFRLPPLRPHLATFFRNDQLSNPFPGKIPALDGVRGIAVLVVMFDHFLLRPLVPDTPAWKLIDSGWLGVDLFFVLSGYLITGILLDTKNRPRYWATFFSRRALRIFPLYYFAVLLVWLEVVFIEHGADRLHDYASMWWFVFFLPNIALALNGDWVYQSNYLGINHLWSVAVEEQFYLAWPLVVKLLPPRVLAVLCVALIHYSYPLRDMVDQQFRSDGGWSMASYVLPYCRMDALAAGGFLAVFFRLGWHRLIPLDRWLARGLFGWMGWEIAQSLLHSGSQNRGTLSALFFAAFVYLALNQHPKALVRRFCELPFLMHLGVYSYGLYVFHQMFRYIWMALFGDRLMVAGWSPVVIQTLYMLLAFGGTYFLARLSWALLEKPFLKLKEL